VTQFGRSNSITYQNLGTVVIVTPRVGPEGVVTMEIDVDHAQLGPIEEGAILAVTKEGATTRTPNRETLTAKTTVRVPSGQSVVLGGSSRRTKSGKELLIVLTPHALEPGR
jgi:type II secretory pathway component GspD/PulD (secretin)